MTHPTSPSRPTNRRKRVHDERRDEGTVTAFTVVLVTALLACAGLVLDGGLALTARVRAVSLAQEAARAGAQELDLTTYRTTGTLVLRPDTAVATAKAYLAAAGADGTATARATTVTVTVRLDQRTGLLALVGLGSLTVTGHATAEAATSLHTGP
jgi:Flp pilus assembly protein TadG